MKNIYFGTMEGEFEGEGNDLRFKAWNAIGEGGFSFNVLIRNCVLIENSASALIFDYGFRRFVFRYSEYAPLLNKISMTVNFFKVLPVIGTKGEISFSDQKLISEMFDTNVNQD